MKNSYNEGNVSNCKERKIKKIRNSLRNTAHYYNKRRLGYGRAPRSEPSISVANEGTLMWNTDNYSNIRYSSIRYSNTWIRLQDHWMEISDPDSSASVFDNKFTQLSVFESVGMSLLRLFFTHYGTGNSFITKIVVLT